MFSSAAWMGVLLVFLCVFTIDIVGKRLVIFMSVQLDLLQDVTFDDYLVFKETAAEKSVKALEDDDYFEKSGTFNFGSI